MTKRIVVLLLTLVICIGNSFSAAAAENIMDVMCAPNGILVTPEGDLFVTDTYHKVVWKVTDGKASIFAGSVSIKGIYGESSGGYVDGLLEETLFQKPWAIVPFIGGYAVSDSGNNAIRLLSTTETKTLAGGNAGGYIDGTGTGAAFRNPTGLAVDEQGNLYVADTNNGCIRKVTTSGQVTTFISGLKEPTGLFYRSQTLYIAESGSHRILAAKNGDLTVLAGGREEGFADGTAAEALFSNPQGITVSDDGIIYIADTGNAAVRKLQEGTVSTVLYNPPAAMSVYPVSPTGLAVRGDELLICDNFARKLISIKR